MFTPPAARRSVARAALAALALATACALAASPAEATNTTDITANGCKAQLYNKTAYVANAPDVYAYAATIRLNSVSCSLATYHKYRTSPGSSGTVYTTSKVWGATYAEVYGPNPSYIAASYHYVTINGPVSGTWHWLAG